MILPLVKKEILDLLRDPRILFGMIVLPLIMFGVLGEVVNYGTQQAIAVAQPTSMIVGIVDEDKTELSKDFISYIKKMTKEAVLLETIPDDPGKYAETKGLTGIILVLPGFEDNVSRGIPGKIIVYTYMKEVSMAEASRVSAITGLVSGYGGILKQRFAEKTNVSVAFVYNPVNVDGRVELAGKTFSAGIANALTGLLFSVVFAPLIVVGYASQIAATTMGVEKEEHTLEVLLSLPVNRKSIVVAKLSGSIIISILATLGLSMGLYLYIRNINEMTGGSSFAIDLLSNLFTPVSMLAIILALVVGVILATSLSMLLGIFGKDVRSSQSLSGAVWTLVFIVGYGLAMIQFSSLSDNMQLAIAAVPLSAPVLALKLSLTGISELVWVSIVFHIIEIIVILTVLARIISSEVMLTGLGIIERLKKTRKR